MHYDYGNGLSRERVYSDTVGRAPLLSFINNSSGLFIGFKYMRSCCWKTIDVQSNMVWHNV